MPLSEIANWLGLVFAHREFLVALWLKRFQSTRFASTLRGYEAGHEHRRRSVSVVSAQH